MPDPAPAQPPDRARRALASARSWLRSRAAALRGLPARVDWALMRKDWDAAKALLARHYVALVILGALGVSLGALLIGLWRIPLLVNSLLDDLQANAGDPEKTRGNVVALAAVLAAITIIGTLITQSIRVWTSERQTRTIEQGHVTDRLTRAIEQLGAEKTSKRILKDADGAQVLKDNVPVVIETSVPNLEVRLGAIYALERIARDSARDHVTIMEILCAYIRENAKGSEAPPAPLDALPERGADDLTGRKQLLASLAGERQNWLTAQPQPRIDLQAALTVIGRRDDARRQNEVESNFRLDLRNANLRKAYLSGARLERADLSWARLEGADLREARLEGADLFGARLDGADLSWAGLEGVDLGAARLAGANLRGARLEGADLSEARLEGANLSWAGLEGATLSWAGLEGADLSEAGLAGADLRGARLEGANLSEARLEGADLSEAGLEGANLSEADFRNAIWSGASNPASPAQFADLRTGQDLTQFQLEHVIGNDGTLLPDRLNENGEPYYVWSCWETPPANFEAIVATAAGPIASELRQDELRRQFLAGPDNPRVKTGTPLALDAPYPARHPLARRG